MKKTIAAILATGLSAFATEIPSLDKEIVKLDSGFVQEIAKDSAKLADYKIKATADSLRLVLEGRKDSAAWSGNLPDSLKARFDANKVAIDKKRDSLRADLSLHLDSVKVKVEALKAQAKLQRAAFVATLKEADKVKVAKKIAEIEKKAEARTAAIEKAIADVKAKLEVRKAAK